MTGVFRIFNPWFFGAIAVIAIMFAGYNVVSTLSQQSQQSPSVITFPQTGVSQAVELPEIGSVGGNVVHHNSLQVSWRSEAGHCLWELFEVGSSGKHTTLENGLFPGPCTPSGLETAINGAIESLRQQFKDTKFFEELEPAINKLIGFIHALVG